jgi:hypothetical protein
VGQLRLTRLQLKDGTEILPPAVDATTTPAAVGRSKWESAIHFTGEPKDGVLSTSMSLFIDTKAKPEDVKALQGILTVQFPKALETLAVATRPSVSSPAGCSDGDCRGEGAKDPDPQDQQGR